ncbi:MAG: hypothetical protein AAB225_21765 [Acidobacteriota bacterium]
MPLLSPASCPPQLVPAAPATEANGEVTIRLTATGSGRHTFTIRADNLAVDQPEKELVLREGTPGSLVWKARMNSLGAPWVAVVVPDGDLGQRREAISAAPRL